MITRIRAQTESDMKKKVLFVMALVCILALGACLLAACNQEQTPTVTNAIINDAGELVLIYSDGSAQNLGVITGAQGPRVTKANRVNRVSKAYRANRA